MSDTERDEMYAAIFPTIQSHFDHSSVLSDLEDAAWEVVNVLEDVLKPRTITTVEELDALAPGSVVLCRRRAWTRFTPKQIHGGIAEIHKWMCPDGGILRADSEQDIILPATVLHEPTP